MASRKSAPRPITVSTRPLAEVNTALNDLRLVLGTRLGVTEETYVDETGPRTPGMAVYVWLTWLQGELVEALSKGL